MQSLRQIILFQCISFDGGSPWICSRMVSCIRNTRAKVHYFWKGGRKHEKNMLGFGKFASKTAALIREWPFCAFIG